jgi:hypothetical protein
MSSKTSSRRSARVALTLLILWGASVRHGFGEASAEKRVALVIGNSHYHDGTDISGVNNADAMTEVLEDLNFQVISHKDADVDTMRQALMDLPGQIEDATMVVVFYSGHGFHHGAENFLVPVGGGTTSDDSIALGKILDAVGSAPAAAAKLVILDACRNNPAIGADQQGFTEPPAIRDRLLLLAFAASFGQTATAGGDKDRSPYTMALVRHLREAGVTVQDLFAEVRRDVAQGSAQLPVSFGEGSFALRPAVRVRTSVDPAVGDVLLLVNGEISFDREAHSPNPVDLVLHAGDNPLAVLVASQRTYRKTHSWDRTEGWGYCMRLFGPGGTELQVAGCDRDPCFSGSEDAPFKDGSHHGKVFTVARAVLHVDPETAALTLANPEPDVWKHELPPFEQNPGVLYEIKAEEVLAKALNVDAAFLTQTLAQIPGVVKTFFPTLPAFALPDLSHWVARVHGNQDYAPSAVTCMRDREADRLKDLRAGVTATLTGNNPLPLKGFDDGLSACIAAEEHHRMGAKQEAKVWTAFEDLSEHNVPFSCPAVGGPGS